MLDLQPGLSAYLHGVNRKVLSTFGLFFTGHVMCSMYRIPVGGLADIS